MKFVDEPLIVVMNGTGNIEVQNMQSFLQRRMMNPGGSGKGKWLCWVAGVFEVILFSSLAWKPRGYLIKKNKNNMAFKWSDDCIRNIIEVVRVNSYLYNKRQKLFKDMNVKSLTWENVAKNIAKKCTGILLCYFWTEKNNIRPCFADIFIFHNTIFCKIMLCVESLSY